VLVPREQQIGKCIADTANADLVKRPRFPQQLDHVERSPPLGLGVGKPGKRAHALDPIGLRQAIQIALKLRFACA